MDEILRKIDLNELLDDSFFDKRYAKTADSNKGIKLKISVSSLQHGREKIIKYVSCHIGHVVPLTSMIIYDLLNHENRKNVIFSF